MSVVSSVILMVWKRHAGCFKAFEQSVTKGPCRRQGPFFAQRPEGDRFGH